MIDPYDAWEPWSVSVELIGGPSRIYDSEAAAEPMPPKHPFGFVLPKKECQCSK